MKGVPIHRARIAGLALLALSMAPSALLVGCRETAAPPETRWQDAPLTQGALRVVQLGGESSGVSAQGPPLSASFANDVHYAGHEDNDIRGNLDGTFKWGWNQPGQTHVRVGRRERRPSHGELELFRVTHRFADLDLPRDAKIHAARFELQIEQGAKLPVRAVLYGLHGDFDPGRGGTSRDNVSPPAPGEVWWNHRGWPDRPWGLPGASSVGTPESGADTPPEPLAEASYESGDAALVFESDALADSVEAKLRVGEPANFLLKLTDRHEDLPGTVLVVYAASEGEPRAPSRRPRLQLEWTSPRARTLVDRTLRLERGRHRVERLALPGEGPVVIDFAPQPGSGPLTIELRGGGAASASEWRRVPSGRPIETPGWSWVEVRLRAARDPVVLGREFRTGFRDTWIRSAAPEEQRVEFLFTAPSGRQHSALAEYAGDYRWQLAFLPDELGSWSYQWTKTFTEDAPTSVEAHFDVVGGGLENVVKQLATLRGAFESLPEAQRAERNAWFGLQLMALERSGIQSLPPGGRTRPESEALRAELRRVRESIGGKPLPETLPLEPSPPAPWQTETEAP